MECKSIQISSSSSSATQKYDVFVSFRGEDIRNSFADHLFAAFQKKGIDAFKDDKNIKQGEHISTELVQAIEGSQVLIVVFSKHYATSTWCLQELAKMVDCTKKTRQSVLPIFYDVSPSEVRKQSGDFGKALAEHEERFKQDLAIVQRWRGALVQVVDLSGWDIRNKPQNGEIEKIVERVKSILGYKLSSLDGFVGMESRVEQLEELMEFNSVVGICGMGGIGKTTLARAVYGRNFHQYGACCFIDDISKIYRDGGLISTQKQLICQTLNEEIQDIRNISQATSLIKTRLSHLKALIVLDNVDEVEQLQRLGVDRDCLCAGSTIIVISRDRHILDVYGVDKVYNVQLLNEDEAHQLFCRKAFKPGCIMSCDDINRKYEKLIDLAIKYAHCLPLAVEVLGSFLCGRDISEWRSALARLRDNPKKEIMNVLQISFDGLEPEEKEIFLDIACFLNRESKYNVTKILDYHGFHPDIGIRVLIDKSLITIEERKIRMHDMLQDLGRKIVRQNAPNEPWKWSRIWCNEDFQSLMFEKMAMDNLEAICLVSKKSFRGKFSTYREEAPSRMNEEENTTFRAEALTRMNRLRLLIIQDMNFSGSLNCLSNELRYLLWVGYPFSYFPASCELTKIVELILPYSNINQLWEGIKPLYNLKIMDLNHSQNLVKTPDFTGAPNLEQIELEECTKLEHVHPSIGLLGKLVWLNLKMCTSLMSLPSSIFSISSLRNVNIEGCSKLFHGELSENARQGISNTAIQCRSSSSSSFRRHNDVFGSSMPSLARFYCLRELYLSYCNLPDLPEAMGSFYCLKILYLKGNNFVTLPRIIKELSSLTRLELDNCKQLAYLFEFPIRTTLPVRKVFCDVGLSIFNCPKLVQKERWSSIASSWMLEFLKVHKESSPRIAITIPGTQIPSWFNTQSVGDSWFKTQHVGDSIIVKSFPDVYDSDWIGAAFCASFVALYDPLSSSNPERFLVIELELSCHNGPGGHIAISLALDIAEIKLTDGVTVELVHLCLAYFPRQQLIDLIEGTKPNIHDLDGFSFKLRCWYQGYRYRRAAGDDDKGLHFEVKNCGVRVVYKQDLE